MTTPRRQIQHQRKQATRRRADPSFANVDRDCSEGSDGDAGTHSTPGSFGVRVAPTRHTRVTHHVIPPARALYHPHDASPLQNPTSLPVPPSGCRLLLGLHLRVRARMTTPRRSPKRDKHDRWRLVRALCLLSATPALTHAQIVHGTVSSAVGSGRVAGAVVLLLDSALTTHARTLTSDSGTFLVGAGSPGRFHLKVMRIGFTPTESRTFDLARDTTIDLALTDIPVVLPALVLRDRNDCRLHPDTSAAGLATFALWDQARTALLAAAITMEQQAYRFTKLLQIRVYDVRQRTLRDIALHETITQGTTPWSSLPAEQLRRDGYMSQDDSGLTFYAPDLDVLLSAYFTEEHCFHVAATSPDSSLIGLVFEPAARPRHVEIRGTLWLDAASKELRRLGFAFVNLPGIGDDTLLGGHVEFARLTTGAWILPSWSIRMPTPVRNGVIQTFSSGFGTTTTIRNRGRWHLTTDFIRVVGGDVRVVRQDNDEASVLWRRTTGSARLTAFVPTDTGPAPSVGALIRLAGSPYAGYSDLHGVVGFEQILPGTYLFEATTLLHDAVEAPLDRAVVTIRPGELTDALVKLKPIAQAAAEACQVSRLDRNSGVIAGRVLHGDDPVGKVRVTLQWVGGDPTTETREDGYFRFCNVPVSKLILVRASFEKLMVTTTVTLSATEIVHPIDLKLQP